VFDVPLDEAKELFPEYEFITRLTASVQKAAFHVRQNGHDLCLKVIAPNTEAGRLQREVAALLKVDHPNVVQFVEYTFSVSKKNHRHFVVEHFIPGSDLSERLNIRWAPGDAARFFGQLLDGLGELRKHNLVHRDLKPSNIRVHTDGRPVIIDLGLARHLDRPDLTRTAQGARIGTPAYFAPEQFQGTKQDIDHRTDLFAVGILLYEALLGRHPFFGSHITSLDELEQAVCSGSGHLACDDFKRLSHDWQLVLKRMLERPRERRPADASQAAALLRKIAGVGS
jgi:serine/threonine-protein kinase